MGRACIDASLFRYRLIDDDPDDADDDDNDEDDDDADDDDDAMPGLSQRAAVVSHASNYPLLPWILRQLVTTSNAYQYLFSAVNLWPLLVRQSPVQLLQPDLAEE